MGAEWMLMQDILESAVQEPGLVSQATRHETVGVARRETFLQSRLPATGSKGASTGAKKLTRRVFENILKADYIAQNFSFCGERAMKRFDGTVTTRKVDIRHLPPTREKVASPLARVYRGQTTKTFVTPGGGFAPVFQL